MREFILAISIVLFVYGMGGAIKLAQKLSLPSHQELVMMNR